MTWFERLATDIGDAWQRDIVDLHKQPQVVLLVTFLVTFGLVRFITHSIRDQRYTKIFHNMSAGAPTCITWCRGSFC